MFFYLSKIFWFGVQPLSLVMILIAFGLVAGLVGWRKLSAWLTGVGLASLLVIGLSPLGLLMMNGLEDRIPRPPLPERVDGIIILGGALDTRVSGLRGEPELNDAADRVTEGVALARRFPQARVIFSGGNASVFADDISEAGVAGRLMESLGLEPGRIELEDRSRDTYENAVQTRQMAEPKPGEVWLLVTSAFHMPRAVGCFRVVGFDVVPWPVDYRTPTGAAVWRPSAANIRNVEKVHFAIREYIGLAAYWLSGRTDALLPRA
ncbi:YdcF family protein [Aureimonas altamirensis]|uniref:YdcF family protein n=1 Tax=Aureimonas altamirensis TaxID=370622 RepID=UPI001E4E63F3|nr:YdcF family protein [Aureimonas altamirensis]UHD44373.1 YdcF family protein [Aureimonas altamirensis]